MISIGPSIRRKSFERADPTLPKPIFTRQPSSNGRTIYKQLKLPLEQLSEYPKRHLFTMGNMSTQKSMSHTQEINMKQSRYDYDHHNTDSIAQLFEGKNDSNLPTTKAKRSDANLSSDREHAKESSDQKMSLESESIVTQREGEKEEVERDEEEMQGKEGENYDDYVLGDKVEEQAEEKVDKTVKKYALSNSTKTLTGYLSSSQSQLRLQRQHFLNQRRRLAQINEDRQIAMLMAQYKNNKHQMLTQAAKRHEAARVIATLHHPQPNKIQKSVSLPALKPKKELVVPEEYHEERPVEPWKNTKNLLAKNLERRQDEQRLAKLKATLSYGKLGFGRKKIRTICEQEILEQEMNSLEEIKAKLRSKGIAFDANKLKKGLLNQKNEPYDHNILQCPDKRLPSNPIYKKFPL